ncbi:thiamine pyrophosphate-dependent enzyme [Nocardia farcinica]|uniref:thiamine pyrophosphate-dependent enzyme n=1 Tax=Nocardia farcinica TaxID=37329 RepID=UPI002458FFFB|nr:thiamine pyrophosphate-dependent enzyme [Nocardia farcinica]
MTETITVTEASGVETATAGAALVDGLLDHGVDTVFGIPGVQTYELFEALGRAGDRIELISARHEQACAYMAMGYAQSTGRLGVCSVVPGPGILNAAAGLLTARGTNSPVLCLTGEIPTDFMGKGFGHLHEMPDQLTTLRSFVKSADNVLHPSEAKQVLARAIRAAREGRPGPAVVATPWNVLTQSAPVAPAVPLDIVQPAVDPSAVAAAAELIATARHPMILVGGGARGAVAEINALATLLQAPVVAHRSGKGIVDEAAPLGFTCAEGFARWLDCDLVLTIGTRAELLWFRWPKKPAAVPSINIDIDPTGHTRLQPTVAITADAAAATAALLDALVAAGVHRPDRTAEFTELKAAIRAEIDAYLQPHRDYLAAIRRALPRDGFFVEEVSQIGFASYFSFPVSAPRQFVTCGYQGNLGYGFPTALGVKAAHRDRAVVAVSGDGGFQFGIQELATAVQHRLGVAVVVFDNAAFGNVKADQERIYGRAVGSELRNPDFVAVARAYGAHGCRVDAPEDLERAVAAAVDRDLPSVIVVPMPLEPGVAPWRYLMPDLPPGSYAP